MSHRPHNVPGSLDVAARPPASTPAVAPRLEGPASPVRELTAAGQSIRPFLNPLRILAHLARHRHLTLQLTRRELAARYRGSLLGTVWALLVPLSTLAVYTFVFSVVFRARWGAADEGRGVFALTLFAGLIPFNVFSEVVSTSPVVVLGNPGYVKRVVFPLEVLPLVRFLCALFQGLVSAGVLVLGLVVLRGHVPATIALMLVAWIPLMLMAVASAYFLAALGVFIRDIGQAVIVVLPFLFFLSPIIYPIDAVPAPLRPFINLNPIAHVVEDCRRTAIFGVAPDWHWFVRTLVLGTILALAGFLFFMKSKRAFHDAL